MKHEDNEARSFETISLSSDYWSLGISIAEKILGQEAIRFDSRFGLTSKFFKHPNIKKASDQLVNLLCKLLVCNLFINQSHPKNKHRKNKGNIMLLSYLHIIYIAIAINETILVESSQKEG